MQNKAKLWEIKRINKKLNSENGSAKRKTLITPVS